MLVQYLMFLTGWLWRPSHMIHSHHFTHEPYHDPSCPVDGGVAIQEETTPITINMFHDRMMMMMITHNNFCIDLQWPLHCEGQVFRPALFSRWTPHMHSPTCREMEKDHSADHIPSFFYTALWTRALWLLHRWTLKCAFIFVTRGLSTAARLEYKSVCIDNLGHLRKSWSTRSTVIRGFTDVFRAKYRCWAAFVIETPSVWARVIFFFWTGPAPCFPTEDGGMLMA